MTQVSYHETVNDLHGLGLSGKGPFARLEWLALLEEAGKTPLLALIRDGNQAICLPLHQGESGVEALSNWYGFTWQPLTTLDAKPTLFQDLASKIADKTSKLTLSKLADEDGTATALENAFRSAGWHVQREQCDINHVLEVQGRSFSEYLASRPGKLRTTLKRKAKKVELVLKRQFDAADWAAYEEIYRYSWKPEEGDPDMLRKFAQQESDAGRYLFGMASAEGQPVAAQFWTVEDGAAYIHKLAHLETAQKISPGTTLTAALFEEVIDKDGVQLVDFGTGNDGYKKDWMEFARPRFQLTCLRRSDPRNWPLLTKSAIRKLVSHGSPS